MSAQITCLLHFLAVPYLLHGTSPTSEKGCGITCLCSLVFTSISDRLLVIRSSCLWNITGFYRLQVFSAPRGICCFARLMHRLKRTAVNCWRAHLFLHSILRHPRPAPVPYLGRCFGIQGCTITVSTASHSSLPHPFFPLYFFLLAPSILDSLFSPLALFSALTDADLPWAFMGYITHLSPPCHVVLFPGTCCHFPVPKT